MPRAPRNLATDLSATLRRALRQTARTNALDVGAYVRRRASHFPSGAMRKHEGDFVTLVDYASERTLRKRLLEEWPTHGFLGEESSPTGLDAELVWVVDPIDGTSNFAQGLPTWAVSIGCLHHGWPVAAAVYCAVEDAVYSAAAGLGAFRNRRRLHTPKARLDDAAVVGTQWHRGDRAELAFVEACNRTGARVRVHGCTVQQLCDVAVGRLHANIQQQGRLWDFAAAGLIAVEAGATFTDWSGAPIFPVADPGADRHYPSITAAPGVLRQLGAIRDLALD